MKLHEYQSKRIFAQYGVPIPKGEVATKPDEAREIAQRLGTKVVVKSQVLVGGRGKAGGTRRRAWPRKGLTPAGTYSAADIDACESADLPRRDGINPIS